MLIVKCPFCGNRPEIEFRYAGEAHLRRPADPGATTALEWSAYLYARTNPVGTHAERWYHVHGCRRYFNALRNTVNNRFETACITDDPYADLATEI